MKKIRILSVRKNTDPHIRALESDYEKRLRPHCGLRLDDIRQTYADGAPEAAVLEKEAKLFEEKIGASARPVVLDASGKEMSSPAFAEWLGKEFAAGGELIFVIGGPFGVHERIKKSARAVVSLSKMTLTHEMARLILLEQIYRGFNILSGGKYHK